jgi:hypothetical protein
MHNEANYGAHLPHTSVTREKVNLEVARKHANNVKSYHEELARQLEEKNQLEKMQKLNENIAGLEHTKKWNNLVNKFKKNKNSKINELF